ncbi:MAG: hypothetical protein FWG90_01800 [Oscillospiraceae bacterium]|nr:hypothetical protein [Oscillospiraceae bacterium]
MCNPNMKYVTFPKVLENFESLFNSIQEYDSEDNPREITIVADNGNTAVLLSRDNYDSLMYGLFGDE